MFKDRLVQLRKEHKLSQYALAEKLGFTRGQISNYELGAREPDLETLQKIADFFEVSLDYINGRTDDRTATKKEPIKDTLEVDIEELFVNNPRIQPKYKGKELTDEEMVRVSKMLEVILDRMDNEDKNKK